MTPSLEFIQRFVLRTERLPVFRYLYETIYVCYRLLLVKTLARHREVEAIYAKGGERGNIGHAGLSDIDLIILTSKSDREGSYQTACSLVQSYARLNTFCPLMKDCYSASVERAVLFRQMKFFETGTYYHKGFNRAYGIAHLENFATWPLESKHWINLSYESYGLLGKRMIAAGRSGVLRYPIKQLERATSYLCHALRVDAQQKAQKLLSDLGRQRSLALDDPLATKNLYQLWSRYLHLLEEGIEEYEEGERAVARAPHKLRFSELNISPNEELPTWRKIPGLEETFFEQSGLRMRFFSYSQEFLRLVPTIVLSRVEDLEQIGQRFFGDLRYFSREWDLRFGLKLGSPVFITEKMLRFSFQNFVYMHGMLEPFYFGRDGIRSDEFRKLGLLQETELLSQISYFDPWQRLHYFLSDRPFGVNFFERLLYGLAHHNADYFRLNLSTVFGLLPRKRLLLEEAMITRNQPETWREYLNRYQHEAQSSLLNEYVEERLYLKEERLPVWVEANKQRLHSYLFNLESVIEQLTSRELALLDREMRISRAESFHKKEKG